MWIDIASIVFICVTANHLGLVKAIEETFDIELHILNCPKCFCFWLSFTYGLSNISSDGFIAVLAVSFLASYSAIWLELFEGIIDTLYMKLYETIYPNTDNDTASADADSSYSTGSVS